MDHELAILIPTRNRPAILKRTLQELLRLGFGDHPLLVYDDASDNPAEVENTITSIWPNARLLKGNIRSGQAKGRNRLMQGCPCKYALFLDDDSWPEAKESVFRALQTMVKDRLSIVTFTYKSLATGELSVGSEKKRSRVPAFLGGASLFDVPSVMSVGGYREYFIYGFEEPELGMRLWLAASKVEFLPGVVVLHNQFYTPDEKRDYREYDFLYARNIILMASLNMPLLIGLSYGVMRSIRWSSYRKRNFTSKLQGMIAGIVQSFSRWRERKPCSVKQAFAWMRFWRQ